VAVADSVAREAPVIVVVAAVEVTAPATTLAAGAGRNLAGNRYGERAAPR
jgi:hypothetical protein